MKRLLICLSFLSLLTLLFSCVSHAQSPLTYNVAPCTTSTSTGNCGSIPVTLPYSPIFIPSTSTSTQVLPAAGVPFYEPDYPTVTPYVSPCGTVSFVCAERIFDLNTWNVTLAGLPGGNPCPGAGSFTGVPATHTPSGSDVLVVSPISTANYTVMLLTYPGGSCTILEDVNINTGAITNVRVPVGITGSAGEIHADYNTPSVWYGCLTNNNCYQGQKLNSASMAVNQIFDLSNSAVANLPLSVSDPAVIGGGGWVTNSSNDFLCGQLGPQDNALLGVCVDPSINPPNGCAIWWRVDTGDLGGGACWPGGPPTCSGCAQNSPLANTLTFTGGGVTGNGTTASGTLSGTPVWGTQHISVQGCASFNGRELTGVSHTGTSISWNSSFTGTATGCVIGQQLGLHGDGMCQDGAESNWSLVNLGVVVWAQGTTTTWHASTADGQGHRTCGNHSLVLGPSAPPPEHWIFLNSSIPGSVVGNGAGKLPANEDGHYFWPVNVSETNLMYAMSFCNSYSAFPSCPSANANCPACGEVTMLQPIQSGGKTYRFLQTRKNICANAPILANCIGESTAFFYDEVSGQCSFDGVLCIFSTNWADTSTGVPTLGQVTQGAQTLYRNDIIVVFMPLGAPYPVAAPSKLIIAEDYNAAHFRDLLVSQFVTYDTDSK